MKIDLDKKEPISAGVYARLEPWQQGYTSYFQAAWNKAIPNENPYPISTPDHEKWKAGNEMAVIHVQDGEE